MYPPGFVYDVAGTSIFANSHEERASVLSYANSQLALQQLIALSPTLNYEVGQISKLPVVSMTAEAGAALATKAVHEAKIDWDGFETSWGFARNPLVALAESE
jgi:hypothetical protein